MNQPCAMAGTKHVVAVLDEDPAVQASLKFLLEIEGFEVRIYDSANGLLDDADLRTFYCLIVDFHLRKMNGLDVVAKLRERQISTRAILVTGHPRAEVCERAAALGIQVVVKPFLGPELLECIRVS
jgi:FixJ family two-component response regulator